MKYRFILIAFSLYSGFALAQDQSQDRIVLINSDTVFGVLQRLSGDGQFILKESGASFEREIDQKFVNLAQLSSGKIVFQRPQSIIPHTSIEEGTSAVFIYSTELENKINLLFPGSIKRTIDTYYNRDIKILDEKIFLSKGEDVPVEYKQLKKLFNLYAYGCNSFIVLIESDGQYKISWHFFSKPISETRIVNFLTGKLFKLQEEWTYFKLNDEISNVMSPFTMKFSEDGACLFKTSKKISDLTFRVQKPSSIVFKNANDKWGNNDTAYEVVFVKDGIMRYSKFHGSNGIIIRKISIEN